VKILVLGCGGQVGHELMGALACFASVVGLTRADADLGDSDALRRKVREIGPDAVVNAASFNDVDGAERDPDAAMHVNATAVAALGEEARGRFALVHYSTDFVFDGRASRPYVETDAVGPLGAYGRSKAAGERALAEMSAPAIVLRTAWVYSLRRKSFVSAMLRLAREREVVKVVADQAGNPTFCRDLAQATALLLYGARRAPLQTFEEAGGLYHLAGSGVATRYELAKAVVELARPIEGARFAEIVPIPSSEYALPAERPAYAPLDCTKIEERFGIRLPPWRDSLARALADS